MGRSIRSVAAVAAFVTEMEAASKEREFAWVC